MLGNLSRIETRLKFSKHLRWVAPFGDPWIKAHSQLPTAYRSVSRPSSPVHAKASTKCPYDTSSFSLPMLIVFAGFGQLVPFRLRSRGDQI